MNTHSCFGLQSESSARTVAICHRSCLVLFTRASVDGPLSKYQSENTTSETLLHPCHRVVAIEE